MTLYQNYSNCSAPMNKILLQLLLIGLIDFKIISQDCSLGNPLSLEQFRFAKHDGWLVVLGLTAL